MNRIIPLASRRPVLDRDLPIDPDGAFDDAIRGALFLAGTLNDCRSNFDGDNSDLAVLAGQIESDATRLYEALADVSEAIRAELDEPPPSGPNPDDGEPVPELDGLWRTGT